MVVRQEGSQAERVLCAVDPGADDRAFQPHPGGFQDRRPTLVSRAEEDEGVPMVALECQQPLTGTLSPPADTPSMALLPQQPLVQDNDSHSPQPLPRLPSSPSSSRPGCKRKLFREEEECACAGGCAVDGPGRCTRCWARCLEESERKRRRLSPSHGCSETESSSTEDGVDTFGQYLTAETPPAHMDLNVEQTMDVMTTSGGAEQSVDSVSASEIETAPLDIGVDPPLRPFIVELFSDPVTQQIPDSAAEVDVVGKAVYPPSDPSPAAACPLQHPESCGASGGGDTSSGDDDAFVEACESRPQRISPFLNTPKQRKEERRRILKLSIQKMRDVEDPEHFLRRSVLINNTMKRLQRELREEKMRNSPRRSCYGLYRRPPSPFHYDPLNHNGYLLSDESFGVGDNDRITDDMTDALVTRLEATSSHLVVVPTPSPSPSPLDEPEPCLAGFPPVSSSDDVTTTTTTAACPTLSCLSDVTSSVTESMSVMNSEITSSFFAEEPCSSLSDDLMTPVPESTASLEAVSMTSSVTDLTSSVADMTSFVPDLTSPSCVSSSSSSTSSPPSPVSVACNGAYDSSFTDMVRESQSPSSSCSSESQREKQLYSDIDVVFNNLIHALGDS